MYTGVHSDVARESGCTSNKHNTLICHRKNGLGKNGPARPILDEKMVWPDHSWLTKNGPVEPILATKSGPA